MTKVSTRIIFHNGSVNLDCHLSNQDDNKTYTYINNITKDQIIKVHKLYPSKYKINLTNSACNVLDCKNSPKSN